VNRRIRRNDSRIGSALVGLGALTTFGVVFVVGVMVGRHYPGLLPSLGVSGPREARRGAETRVAERTKPPEPAPVLTFYQELTAPLTSPPPPPAKPKPERVKPAPAETAPTPKPTSESPRPASESTARPAETSATRDLPSATPSGTRYTIQVGAFKVREQAEAVRARLAAAGHDAFVADIDGSGTARYRVRVGNYASRDDARRASERLSATERLSTYVTVR